MSRETLERSPQKISRRRAALMGGVIALVNAACGSGTPVTPSPSERPSQSPDQTPIVTMSPEPSATATPTFSPEPTKTPDANPWNYETVEQGIELWNSGKLFVDPDRVFLQSPDGLPKDMILINENAQFPRYVGVLLGYKLVNGYLVAVEGQQYQGKRYTISMNLGNVNDTDIYNRVGLTSINGYVIENASSHSEVKPVNSFWEDAIKKIRGSGMFAEIIDKTATIDPNLPDETKRRNVLINNTANLSSRFKQWNLDVKSGKASIDQIPPELSAFVNHVPDESEVEKIIWVIGMGFPAHELITANV